MKLMVWRRGGKPGAMPSKSRLYAPARIQPAQMPGPLPAGAARRLRRRGAEEGRGGAMGVRGGWWWRSAVVAIVVVAGLGGSLGPVWAATDVMSVTNMFVPPQATGIGSALVGGSGAGTPGAPSPAPGCGVAVQAAMGAAHAGNVQQQQTYSQSIRQPPGKILTSCVSTLISLMEGLDIFSNAGPFSMQTLIDAAVNFGAGQICQVIMSEFNSVMSQAFNSVAFLKDSIPCGVGLNIPTGGAGGAGGGFCQSLGGPLVNIGTNQTIYSNTINVNQTSLQSAVAGQGGSSNALQLLGY